MIYTEEPEHPFVVGYYDNESHRIFSLRSHKKGMNVKEVAKIHSGGGHLHAAGFTVPHAGKTI